MTRINRNELSSAMVEAYKNVLRNNFETQYGIYLNDDGTIEAIEDDANDGYSDQHETETKHYLTTVWEQEFNIYEYCEDEEDETERANAIDEWAGQKDWDVIAENVIAAYEQEA